MNTEQRTPLLTVREVAHRLRMHPMTVYRKIDRGEIPAIRLGTGPSAPLRIEEATLRELLQPAIPIERN